MTRTAIHTVDVGDLTGDHRLTILAETRDGDRFIFPQTFADSERANKFARRVREAGSIDPALWAVTFPRYGSEAYAREELEAWEWAQAIRMGHANEADAPDNVRTLL